MNKTKTILAAVGGVTLVAVAAAGYFAWSAASAKTAALEGDDEGNDGLEAVREKAETLLGKPIYPSAASVRALGDAREVVKAWKDEAFSLASRGDRRIQPTTDAAFKEFIVGDARRLQSLPAGAEKKTLDAEFDFGPFRPYIAEGKMPELAQLKELQRKWDDVATLIETLSACGVEGVKAIDLKAAEAPKAEEPPADRKAKGKAKAKAKAAEAAPAFQPATYAYVISCRMRPASLVKALNAFASCERFTVVSDFALRREKDTIAEGLGAVKKEETAAAPSGRRRRRGAAAAESAAEPEAKAAEAAPRVTVVTDPGEEMPFETKLTVEVSDFRSAEAPAEKKEGEEEK